MSRENVIHVDDEGTFVQSVPRSILGGEMNYKLSPSDLTFLYNGCKHCFVLKVKHGIPQPSIPIPVVFTRIADLQKDHYSGKRTEAFCPVLPPGIVKYGEEWVRSSKLEISGCDSTCYIVGRFDIVAELDDQSFALLDFKTGSPSEAKSEMYARQLHAYVIALENPGKGALALSPISRLGLLYFTPDKCEQSAMDRQILEGELTWVEIERNDSAFMGFLEDVVSLLDGPIPQPQPDVCDWCKYRYRISKIRAGQKGRGTPSNDAVSPEKCPACGGPMQLKRGKFGDF